MDLQDDRQSAGLAQVLRMSAPASLSMLSRTLMQFVDGMMVARLGPGTFSALSIGGLVAFVPESFMIGLLAVVNTYVSQNLGAGRLRRCGQYTWAGLALAVVFAAAIAPLAAVARPLFAVIGHEQAVQPMEVLYFRYMILSMVLISSIRVLEAFFYGIHRPKVVLAVAVAGNAFNVLANYALIFGHFGLPALGLEGAAIGTITSLCLQLAILLTLFLSRPIHRRFGTWHATALRWRQCREILRVGWPAGLRLFIDLLTWAFFMSFLVGWFGKEHLTAMTAVVRYISLSFMPALGISIATTALVGRHIGNGRPDLAQRSAHTAAGIAMAYMGACAVAFWLFRDPMIRLFIPEAGAKDIAQVERIVRIGGPLMICSAIFQLFDALGVVFSGALRGAGDTLWPMLVFGGMSVGVLAGGGYAMVKLMPELQSLGPYLAATTHVIVAGLLMVWRFESGHWRKIDLLRRRPPRAAGETT